MFARLRPVLDVERKKGRDVNIAEYPLQGELIIKQDDEGVVTKRFEFDQVFKPDSTQEEVFNDVRATGAGGRGTGRRRHGTPHACAPLTPLARPGSTSACRSSLSSQASWTATMCASLRTAKLGLARRTRWRVRGWCCRAPRVV